MTSKLINLSGNSISRVWREDEFIFKRQPKYLTDNEIYALRHPELVQYVPWGAVLVDQETVRMEFIQTERVTNTEAFVSHYWLVLNAIRDAGLRHGDLTEFAVLVRNNRPVIIDWAESRVWDDPRPDKRRKGDAFWLRKTMEKLCQK